MKTTIQNKLLEIEKEHSIKILYACESGSRGWEFPSPDSDYDVRFIYIRTLHEYLSIAEKVDHLSFPINDELDIYGWDLSKVLKLIRRSNTTPFEWVQSPIVYMEENGFKEELLEVCKHYFSQRSNAHHYLGIAKGAMETMNAEGEIKIKKLFYVLRPLLAAKWCLERNTIAPMSITPLMDLLPDEMRKALQALIIKKSTAPEGFMITPDKTWIDWIGATEQLCIKASGHLERDQFDAGLLDDLFRKKIYQYDHTRT
jgi:predicted nucleotidyltransferase